MDARDLAQSSGGVISAAEIRAAGISRRALEAALRDGLLERVRIGWFALPELSSDTKTALALGGRLACASVAAAHGLWMLSPPVLHVEIARNDGRSRGHDPRTVLHWGVGIRSAGARSQQPLASALASMISCVPELDALCAIDDALHRGVVSSPELLGATSARALTVLMRADPRSESGVETVFRCRAVEAGIPFRHQVPIPGGLRVDFLIGDHLVVEVDGSAHHAGEQAFTADRERDAWLAAIGYRVIRFSYAQVVHRWHEVESTLRLLIARGEHLSPVHG